MTILFADTSFFVAYLNPRDPFHSAACSYMRDNWQPVLSTQWVRAELGNFLASRDRRAFAMLVRELLQEPRFTILPADDASFGDTIELYRRRPDKQWSFTDCASFRVMKLRRIRESLTTDHHFEQAGFVALLK